MSIVLSIILVILLGVMWVIKRRGNFHSKKGNRYVKHQAAYSTATKTADKKLNRKDRHKVRRNRYHRKSSHPCSEKPKTEEAATANALLLADPLSNDADTVLGLNGPLSLPPDKRPIPTAAQITLQPPSPPSPVIVFYVMAEDSKPYRGYELLQTILSLNMRFGKYRIFHRHQMDTGQGPVLFSLSSAVHPGTFDLQQIGGFSTIGLSLFFNAEEVKDPLASYELMLKATGQLIEELGGQALDESRQRLTPAKVVIQRRQLRNYVAGCQTPNVFEEIVDE